MMGVGMSVRFVPSFDESQKMTAAERRAATISATIVYINWEQKYFTAEWESEGAKCRESFKFGDIGKQVTVGGRKQGKRR